MQRRQSLRPRQLDIFSRIKLVRSDEDLVMEEDESTVNQKVITSFAELSAVSTLDLYGNFA